MNRGETPTVDELFSLAYEELRRLATVVRRSAANATLSPTALVHEAWVKLAGRPGAPGASEPTDSAGPHASARDRLHFRRIVARAMRQVLVDAARRRQAEKRGGGVALVTFDDDGRIEASAEEFLALHDALDELSGAAPRQAQVVEMRFFGGFEVREVAEHLGVSEATVMRDWRAARAWLNHRLRPADG